MEVIAMYIRVVNVAKEELYRKIDTQKIYMYKHIEQEKGNKILIFNMLHRIFMI